MKLLIGSDKSGFTLKENLKAMLLEQGYAVEDKGTVDVEEPMRFCDVAPVVAQAVSEGNADRAILICGTGMGMAQVASMWKGVFAACCESVYSAKMSRAINNSNILCLGGWVVGFEMAAEMVNVFLNTEHTQDLESWRQDFLKKALKDVLAMDNRLGK